MLAIQAYKKYYDRKSGILKDKKGNLYQDVLFVGREENDYVFIDDELRIHKIYCEDIKSFDYHTETGRKCGPWENEDDFRTFK